MEYRQLGRSGLKVPELCFGAGTIGTRGEFFEAWSQTSQEEADRIIGICMDAGLNFFDTADVYSGGGSEIALGKALAPHKREDLLISTKCTFRFGPGPNNVGSSRYHLMQSVEHSLKRLNTDYIDVYHLHAFDATAPVEETLRALDDLVTAGKIRYIACSNFSGWHLMKSLSGVRALRLVALRGTSGLLLARRPRLRVGAHAACAGAGRWRAGLVAARLGTAHRQDHARDRHPERVSRLNNEGRRRCRPAGARRLSLRCRGCPRRKSRRRPASPIPQIALNWLLRRPTVSTLIIGARNEEQLKANLGAVGWKLSDEHIEKLDRASARPACLSLLAPGPVRRTQPVSGKTGLTE